MIELEKLQHEVGEWSRRNFPNNQPYHPLLGVSEEAGELDDAGPADGITRLVGALCHAHLKMEQGIRGSVDKHHHEKCDAAGDLVIYLCDYCTRNRISLADAVEDAWREVSKRDWTTNKSNGKAVKNMAKKKGKKCK